MAAWGMLVLCTARESQTLYWYQANVTGQRELGLHPCRQGFSFPVRRRGGGASSLGGRESSAAQALGRGQPEALQRWVGDIQVWGVDG